MTPAELAECREYLSLVEAVVKNCGTGAGGFQPGNQCGHGGHGPASGRRRTPEQRERARKRFHKRLKKEFPFLKGKDIGHLTVAPGDRPSSGHLAPNQITEHEHDILHGTLSDPDNGVRKPRTVKEHLKETKKWSLSATVSTNPMHGVMAGAKKYRVDFSSVGPNYAGHDFTDYRNSRTQALAVAAKGHAGQIKDYLPRLAGKGKPTAKELFRAAGTTPARVDRLIYRQETPWHDVPKDMRAAWLEHQRERIAGAPKSFGKGQIRKGPHGEPAAWFDVDTRIAGKVRWGEWTEADDRATHAGHGHESAGKSLAVAEREAPTDTTFIADASTILDAALDATGLRDRWEAGALEGREPLDLLHAVRLEGRRGLRWPAEALLAAVAPKGAKALFGAARAKVGAFFGKARKYTRELFAAAVLAVAGPGPLTQAMEEGIERNHEIQMEYMDRFHAEVIAGTQPLDGTLVARVEQYGAAAWPVAQDAMVREAVAQGVLKECRRVHVGADKPCDPCASEQAKGWIPIAQLLPIGQTPCMNNCHCHVEFRERAGGPPVMVGRRRAA